MTDKEWKELCDWADNNKFQVLHIGDRSNIYVEIDNNRRFVIYNSGAIFMEFKYIDTSMDIFITRNRTVKQIKAIIENLL